SAAPVVPASPATIVPSPVSDEGASGFRPPPPAGPATRRLARELGVDLYQVQGTGPGGRITKEDVKAYVRRLTQGGGATAATSQTPLPDFSQWGPVERERLSKLGRSAAANLSTAWHVIPHVTQHDEADITDLERARRQFDEARDGAKVTMTAVLIKAVVPVLRAYPKFNASFDAAAGEIVYKRYYHIGCAVDTPHGLVVPVIRDVDKKSVREVAKELRDLAARARDRKLELSEMQGASFTITNLGGIGGTAFTPIVNFPEVAILGVARSQPRLQVRDGEVVERLWLPLSLSYDHRVINGADAARFLRALAVLLEQPFRLLIDL
ncbi:MAG: pyruvate dehydrogenase, partial [Planctomycetota bacterium]